MGEGSVGFGALVLIGVGLAMDAFAASICKGLTMERVDWGVAAVYAAAFGIFQGGMPMIGWFLGSRFANAISAYDHWIAFGLLAFIGVRTIAEALGEGDDAAYASGLDWGELLMLSVATSIDALAVGVSFAVLSVDIVQAALIICLVTFAISLVGFGVGQAFGARFKREASIAGGGILIMIGLRVLLEHLGFLG